MLILPQKVYFTACNFGRYGLGGGGDLTDDIDTAYDQYAEQIASGLPIRAFMMEMDPDTNTPERVTEITDEMQARYVAICEDRGLEVRAAE